MKQSRRPDGPRRTRVCASAPRPSSAPVSAASLPSSMRFAPQMNVVCAGSRHSRYLPSSSISRRDRSRSATASRAHSALLSPHARLACRRSVMPHAFSLPAKPMSLSQAAPRLVSIVSALAVLPQLAHYRPISMTNHSALHAHSIVTATASSWAKAPVSWSSKRSTMP